MSQYLTQQHQTAPLPPSDPRFRTLDSVILKLEAEPRQPHRAVLRWYKRWIERNVPAYEQGGR